MNVLLVASDNNRFSGAFLSMTKLAELLINEYHCNVLVLLPAEGSGKELLDKKSIPTEIVCSYDWIVPLKGYTSAGQWIKKAAKIVTTFINVPKVVKLIKKYKIDLIHLNTSYTFIGALAGLRTGVPIIWHIREFLEEDQGRKMISRKICYGLMNKSTKLIAISNSIANKYGQLLNKNKIVMIHNGIDVDDYFCKRPILQDDTIHILMVGGLVRQKGQWQAISACMKIHDLYGLNIELSLVGKGSKEYTVSLENMVKEGHAESYIHFYGAKENTSDYYKQSDIVLMCSSAEAFGRVTVEAMLSGAIVIGAESAGTSDIIHDGETGYTYENRNIDELVSRIMTVVNNRDVAREIAEHGQKVAMREFSANRNALNVYKLYESVLH